jgi:EAL domain-containing protein (putative c-di-GMP-specific phosphodiesterase class I)
MAQAEGGTAFGAAGLPRFAIAFQPIVDAAAGTVVAHEALLRGLSGTPAGGVLARVHAPERQRFELDAIAVVLTAFAGADPAAALHVNLSPAVLLHAPGTVAEVARMVAASRVAAHRVVIEVTEGERIDDADALADTAAALRGIGVRVALDEFGTGYGGMGLLGAVAPDLVKLDMGLTRNIHLHRARRPIVASLLAACALERVGVVAVGVESEGEYRCLAGLGVTLFQGFLFAPPVTGHVLSSDEVSFPPEPPALPIADPWARERAARDR